MGGEGGNLSKRENYERAIKYENREEKGLKNEDFDCFSSVLKEKNALIFKFLGHLFYLLIIITVSHHLCCALVTWWLKLNSISGKIELKYY